MASTILDQRHPDVFTIPILGEHSIHYGVHLIPYIVETVLRDLPASTYVVVADTNIERLWLHKFSDAFSSKASNSKFLKKIVQPGEQTKSREGKAEIEDFLIEESCTRDTVLFAVGGGVVGDLVGFVAATFMRGIRFVQVPTTLLAMVDSSVGGKTAIDTPHGKNLIGAFWQPEYIFIDCAFLTTLPDREFANGMAEVIKTAAIWNEKDFITLETRPEEIKRGLQHLLNPLTKYYDGGRFLETRKDPQFLLLAMVSGSIRVKAEIVTQDPTEKGLRNLVNFGHTVGHAIEALVTPHVLHGECVSVGMILEAEIARHLGVLSQVTVGRLVRCLKLYDLPVSLEDPLFQNAPGAKDLAIENLLNKMKIDKKNAGAEKKVVLLSKVGKTHEMKASPVEDSVIQTVLAQAVKVISKPPNPVVSMSTPGSKSITNRALLLAALGKGTCKLRNMLHSDDTQVMMTALKEVHGAEFSWDDDGETIVVQGGGGIMSIPDGNKPIYLGNAGTAARFMTTVCTLIRPPPTALVDVYVQITGNDRMKQRPIGPLVQALRQNRCKIKYLENKGSLPLAIDAMGGFNGGWINLEASVSSQYVSSILLCAPYAQAPVTLVLTGGQVISQPYIDMTIANMADFGIKVKRRRDEATGELLDIYDIPRGAYKNPEVYDIEPDASSATYPLAIAAITGTKCTIETIGTSSVQGDAKFAKEVLEKMGCIVEQTESSTTVQGPPIGQLQAIEEVDMEEMTDAFLTATVLAAVAKGNGAKTRIVGVANQRVKECNRIQAMMDQLAKFGVFCRELETGLEVYAENIKALRQGASIYCYDDHRVAMAFSVLAAVVPNMIIEERRCVSKTWPNWWDDLRNKIGINVEGVERLSEEQEKGKGKAEKAKAVQPPPAIEPPPPVPQLNGLKSAPSARPLNPSASVFLIGMRGSGKSFVAENAAKALSWPHIDADVYFVEKYKQGVREFVTEKGWPAFRDAETAVLEELLDEKTSGHVISLGGGIVETPLARELLVDYAAKKGPVVHIHRDIDEVVTYLGSEVSRPAYGEPIRDVYDRRESFYEDCSNFEFVNHVADEGDLMAMKSSQAEMGRFFKHVTGQQPNLASNVESGERSYFLSLTYEDLTPALPDMEQLSVGVDALEFRADLLRSFDDVLPEGEHIPSTEYVKDQVAALRRASTLPIVFTVRTKSQGGKFPDAKATEALKLLRLALRLGVEYVDVEISLPEKGIQTLLRSKGYSKVIASWHDWSGSMKWTGDEVKQKYDQASEIGDIVKIIGKATSLQDNFDLYEFASLRSSVKPLLAINMGEEGQLSRILNRVFTPVSHPLLPTRAAPGQLSFKQVQQGLNLIGQLPKSRFFIFGTPISHSLSPTFHNTAFEALGLPHTFERLETAKVGEEIKLTVTAPDFGGASVTIPHKLSIISILDKLSPAADLIGAVNTIIPQVTDSGRILYGDNTDWLGVRAAVSAHIESGGIRAALVIGGGGTARAALYALHDLGAESIYLYNRTRSKARDLARIFSQASIVVVDSLGDWAGDAPNVIVSTVPAYDTSIEEEKDKLYLPQSLFAYRDGPAVVVDMAYKPAETPLLQLAKAKAPTWATVPGVQVLLEQGYFQFEKWTTRRCPKGIVSRRVWEESST